MIPSARIPIWSNWLRRRFLRGFRDDLEAYFGEVRYEAFPFRVVENERAGALRQGLESRQRRCRAVVHAAGGLSPIRLVPGEHEGEVARINVITEAFHLPRHNLGKQDLIEVLDSAEAAYRAHRTAAWVRTLNPLYWLDMALSVVELAPFAPLRLMRLNWRRAALSRGGRALRILLRAGVLVGLVLAVVRLAGLQNTALAAAQRVYDVAIRLPSRFLGP